MSINYVFVFEVLTTIFLFVDIKDKRLLFTLYFARLLYQSSTSPLEPPRPG